MGWIYKVSLVLSGAWHSLKRVRESLWHFAVREHWRRRGLRSHHTALIQGGQAVSGLEVAGAVWLDAYAVLFVEDDCRGQAGTAGIRLGSRVYIGQHCNLRAGGGRISIGDNVLIGNGVSIIATNHGTDPGVPMMDQPWRTDIKDVLIGSDVWIGTHAAILPGSRIEDGAIVAAGAVVRGTVPRNAIFGGVPARQIGARKSAGWPGTTLLTTPGPGFFQTG